MSIGVIPISIDLCLNKACDFFAGHPAMGALPLKLVLVVIVLLFQRLVHHYHLEKSKLHQSEHGRREHLKQRELQVLSQKETGRLYCPTKFKNSVLCPNEIRVFVPHHRPLAHKLHVFCQ